jgi:hypothetical protein
MRRAKIAEIDAVTPAIHHGHRRLQRLFRRLHTQIKQLDRAVVDIDMRIFLVTEDDMLARLFRLQKKVNGTRQKAVDYSAALTVSPVYDNPF